MKSIILKKNHAPAIELIKDRSGLINVTEFFPVSGKVVQSYSIIAKDLTQFIDRFAQLGYKRN